MSQPSEASPAALRHCAACGAAINGRFCAQCGAPADPGLCPACRTQLSPGARFCHHCGAAVQARTASNPRERTAWIIAGAAVLLAGLILLWRAGSFRPSAAPEMANAGNAGSGPELSGPAPDIKIG